LPRSLHLEPLQKQADTPLFDDLVRERPQLVGYIKAERLGGFQIDCRLEFAGLHGRQLSGLGALKDAARAV
jgi:hypothetical protein